MRKDEEDVDGKVSPLNALITTLSVIAIGGFGILVGLLAMLLNKGVSNETVGIIATIYLATLTAICFYLFRVMSKLIDVKINKAESQPQVFQPVQLPAPTTAQLEEPKQSPISVTEHTTKTFDEAFVKRN